MWLIVFKKLFGLIVVKPDKWEDMAPHMQDAYSGLGMAAEAFPLARQMADEVLSLPIGPQMGNEEQKAIIECLH